MFWCFGHPIYYPDTPARGIWARRSRATQTAVGIVSPIIVLVRYTPGVVISCYVQPCLCSSVSIESRVNPRIHPQYCRFNSDKRNVGNLYKSHSLCPCGGPIINFNKSNPRRLTSSLKLQPHDAQGVRGRRMVDDTFRAGEV